MTCIYVFDMSDSFFDRNTYLQLQQLEIINETFK